MNSIEKLVEKLCPDGVEFKKLADVMTLHRGISYKKTDEDEDGPVKVLRANNITLASNTLNFDDVKVVSSSVRVRPDQFVKNKDIIISVASGSKEHVGKVAFITRQNVGYSFGAFMAIIRVYEMILNPKFLFHLLTGNSFESYLQSKIKFTTINNLSAKILGAFPVPIPPLEIQQEIVNILDTYSELVAELVVELEAELEARRLQYQYYRDELLNFSGEPSAIHRSLGLHSTDKVEFKALKDLGSTYGGLTGKNKSDFTDGNARYITYRNIANNISVNTTENEFVKVTEKEKQNRIELGDVLFTGSSETPNEVGMSSEVCSHPADPIFLNSFCFGFRFDDKDLFESGFLKYLFRSNHIRKQIIKCANGVTRFNISKNRFMKIFIPIPPLAIQREIVSILDKFEALINDLSVGLPAEIDARRQQYEYYRDKLLTFKEKV